MKPKTKAVIIVISIILIALVIWIAWGNKALEVNTYTIESEKIGKNFDLYRIAHISDLHNDEIGNNNKKLISKLKSTEPDIIAVTGDLIDSRTTDTDIAVEFMKEAVKIAPCYYANGNHEARVSEDYEKLKSQLIKLGVIVLENESVTIESGEEKIDILGVIDPDFYVIDPDFYFENSQSVMDSNIKSIKNDGDNFTLLLSHRPEFFDVYVKNDIDLVLSGHAHGGQFRLPFIGGLFAPQQGAFPKYDSGIFCEDSTNMIVSRGIGNSLFPFRFNNRPEIIVTELNAK